MAATNPAGSEKYWFDGLPGESLYPTGGAPPTYKRRILVGG